MTGTTDGLTEQEWADARTWADRLKEKPEDEKLFTAFEDWLAENPARAGAYRKVLDVLKLLPVLRERMSAEKNEGLCLKSGRPVDDS